jgi:hypothetical protein
VQPRKRCVGRSTFGFFAYSGFCWNAARAVHEKERFTMQRFPARTLVLMGLTLVAFAWFWWNTPGVKSTPAMIRVVPVTRLDGGP